MFWNKGKLTVDPVYKFILAVCLHLKIKLSSVKQQCSATDSNHSVEAKLNYFLTDWLKLAMEMSEKKAQILFRNNIQQDPLLLTMTYQFSFPQPPNLLCQSIVVSHCGCCLISNF